MNVINSVADLMNEINFTLVTRIRAHNDFEGCEINVHSQGPVVEKFKVSQKVWLGFETTLKVSPNWTVIQSPSHRGYLAKPVVNEMTEAETLEAQAAFDAANPNDDYGVEERVIPAVEIVEERPEQERPEGATHKGVYPRTKRVFWFRKLKSQSCQFNTGDGNGWVNYWSYHIPMWAQVI